MKNRQAWIVAGSSVYLVVGAIACLYLAGALLFLLNKTMPTDLRWDTWWTALQAIEHYPTIEKNVWFSMTAALVLIFVALPLTVAAHSRKDRALHGDARFATPAEVRKLGLMTERPGIVVGKLGSKYLILPGQQFVLMAAPTRSGKGVGVVIPNLLNWPESVVVTDIKGENFQVTSGFRAAHGQEVYLFAPFAEDGRTDRWNPFDGVSSRPELRAGELLTIAQALYPTGELRKDSFWNEQAQNVLLGLALYLLETPGRLCSFGELHAEASGRGGPVRVHLERIIAKGRDATPPLSATCLEALGRVVSMSDNTLSSVMATFSGPLTVYANPLVDAATRTTDFDLGAVRKRRISIYIVIPPNRLADAGALMNLFYSQLIMSNTQVLPEHDSSLKHQCLLLMDEFTAMGRLAVLAKSVGFVAGYGLRLLPVLQSIAQLRATYGEQDARNFVANHAMQIVFAPRELQDAQEYSEALGYLTDERESISRSRTLGAAFSTHQRGMTESRSRNAQRRALMLPQELRELDPAKQIIFLEAARPILCDKIRYYDDPVFTERLYEPVGISIRERFVPPVPIEPFPEYDRVNATEEQTSNIVEHMVTGQGAFAPPPVAPERRGKPAIWDEDLLGKTEEIRMRWVENNRLHREAPAMLAREASSDEQDDDQGDPAFNTLAPARSVR